MEFEWDPQKAATNLSKHKVSFDTAVTIFLDAARVETDSSRPDHAEIRRKAVGRLKTAEIVAVVFTDRGDVRRIISARSASRDERASYDQS